MILNPFSLWDRVTVRLPHQFAAMRGTPGCWRCGRLPAVHRRGLRCALGLHDDGTDAFGGSSSTCLRCGRSV